MNKIDSIEKIFVKDSEIFAAVNDLVVKGNSLTFTLEDGSVVQYFFQHDCDNDGHLWGRWSELYNTKRVSYDRESGTSIPLWKTEIFVKQMRECRACNIVQERNVDEKI